MMIRQIAGLSFVLSTAIALSGCGSSDPAAKAGAAANSNAGLGCTNPIAIGNVPADWTPVTGHELIDGQAGAWMLAIVRFNTVMTAADGGHASATTTTTMLGSDTSALQTVDCKDLGGHADMNFHASPADVISTEDGTVHASRNIQFYLTQTGSQNSSVQESATSSDRFGDESAQDRMDSQGRAQGITSETAMYRINPSVFEIRTTVNMPDQTGHGGNFVFNVALRYIRVGR